MSQEFATPYDAAIASLEAERDEIERALEVMHKFRARHEQGGGLFSRSTPMASGAIGDDEDIASDTFFGMTIADAAVKFLSKWAGRKPQPTNAIIDALERGGLKRSVYTTVYGILSRRAKKQRDVVNVNGDWGLAAWYLGGAPQVPKPRRRVSLNPDTFEKSEPEPEQNETEQKVNGQDVATL